MIWRGSYRGLGNDDDDDQEEVIKVPSNIRNQAVNV